MSWFVVRVEPYHKDQWVRILTLEAIRLGQIKLNLPITGAGQSSRQIFELPFKKLDFGQRRPPVREDYNEFRSVQDQLIFQLIEEGRERGIASHAQIVGNLCRVGFIPVL